MCGACVKVRKCSSASFGSGTARNCFSMAASAAALRKPKMEEGATDDPGVFSPALVEEPASRIADERSPAKRSLMVFGVKDNNVAQASDRASIRRGLVVLFC